MPEHNQLRRCWDRLLQRHPHHKWDDWKHFQDDMADGIQPGWYLNRKDPRMEHGPGNSFFAPYRPANGNSAPRIPRFQMHRAGALVMLTVTERSPVHITPHSKLKTSEWIALCDCGRLSRVKGARFKKQGFCGAKQCEFKHYPKTYRGLQQVSKREQSAFLYTKAHEIPQITEPLFPLDSRKQRELHEAGITFV